MICSMIMFFKFIEYDDSYLNISICMLLNIGEDVRTNLENFQFSFLPGDNETFSFELTAINDDFFEGIESIRISFDTFVNDLFPGLEDIPTITVTISDESGMCRQ